MIDENMLNGINLYIDKSYPIVKNNTFTLITENLLNYTVYKINSNILFLNEILDNKELVSIKDMNKLINTFISTEEKHLRILLDVVKYPHDIKSIHNFKIENINELLNKLILKKNEMISLYNEIILSSKNNELNSLINRFILDEKRHLELLYSVKENFI